MIRITLIFFLLIVGLPIFAQVKLPRLVGDSMVIQRDTKVRVWGWASKGEAVRISFKGRSYNTRANDKGAWQLWLSPSKAGGPYRMEISASNKITINNILVGDVWLCAGQSNMVHYLQLHYDRYEDEIRKAHFPEIRLFKVPTEPNLVGPADDYGEGTWSAANPRNVLKFSVVAYFFAKKLYEKYDIPIGIINASVGGTPIEAWTSADGLHEFPSIRSTIEKNRDTARVNQINREARRLNEERDRRNADDQGLSEKWFDPTSPVKDWSTINIPGYWEDQGIKDLDGVVWYRREIEIPAAASEVATTLYLGRIVDADQVYINGKQIGSTGYQYPQRKYSLLPGVWQSGKNLIVVRVVNNGGKGGFVPGKPYHIRAGDARLDLKGEWHYKVGKVFDPEDRAAPGLALQNQPSALFNGMLSPATPFNVKGFVWYQGESNTGQPEAYRKLLPLMIADWRTKWNIPAGPFLFVQLPNFMERNYLPSESQWAEMRDAQLGALSMPHTAMVVTIDLGEWNDIHPGNKRPIGERLALAAQRLAYGDQTVIYSGPLYKSHRVEGNRMIITFDHVGSGLVTKDGGELRYFSIAAKDGKFVWANAVIRDDNTVEVWSEKVTDPVEVRYAWADNPDSANLTNKEGLLASPFRTKR